MTQIEAGHGKSAGIVSILILIFALIDIIVGFVWISYGGGDASGLWCGLLLALTGILGIVTWVKLNKVAMVFFMVLCIIDIITTIVQAAIAALAFLIWQILKAAIKTQCSIRNGRCDCGDKNVPMNLEDCSWISAIEAIFLTLVIINGLCMMVVFAGSVIGCMATCCAKGPQQQPGVVVVQQPGVIVTTNQGYSGQAGYPPVGQAGYAPGQAVYAPGQAGYPPGQAGYPPGQAGYAPGQGISTGQAARAGEPVQPPPDYNQQQVPPEQMPMKGIPP